MTEQQQPAPRFTHTHSYAILEISFEAWREVRLRLEDSAHGDPTVLKQMHRDYIDYDDDRHELLVFGPVAFKAKPAIVTRAHLLEERSQQFEVLRRDIRELLDELRPPALPPMVLENDRVEAGGAGRKCTDCGHLFEQGERSFEGPRCQDCANALLRRRVEQLHKRQLNDAHIAAGTAGWPGR